MEDTIQRQLSVQDSQVKFAWSNFEEKSNRGVYTLSACFVDLIPYVYHKYAISTYMNVLKQNKAKHKAKLL